MAGTGKSSEILAEKRTERAANVCSLDAKPCASCNGLDDYRALWSESLAGSKKPKRLKQIVHRS